MNSFEALWNHGPTVPVHSGSMEAAYASSL